MAEIVFTTSANNVRIDIDQEKAEAERVKRAIDVLAVLPRVRIGQVSLSGLAKLNPAWFRSALEQWPWTYSNRTPGRENMGTGITVDLPPTLEDVEQRWDFIHTIKVIIAHGSVGGLMPRETVESYIRGVLEKLDEKQFGDAITRIGLLTSLAPDRPEDSAAASAA